MSMFDTYHPTGPLHCPVCDAPLREWQGKEGPNALLHWYQGRRDPVDSDSDEEHLRDAAPPSWSLPSHFRIASYDCACPYPVEAIGETDQGVWQRTILVDADNARQGKEENRAQWSARRRWLSGSTRR